MKKIYLDYASVTPMDPKVRKIMDKWSREPLNPSSIHSLGVKAKKALGDSRATAAKFLSAHADEIIFTSGGTESNGLVLEGAGRTAYRNGNMKPHVIISAVEHSSIIETANMLESHGTSVTRLPVDKNGRISLDQLKRSIKPETFLVSVMTANNEIGTVQSIRDIAKIVRDARKASGSKYPLLHSDACQSVLYEDLNVEKLGVDFLTLDASKAYGPRGVGLLYVRRGAPIEQIIYGGGQEKNLRSGTENIPGIVGFAEALQLAEKNRINENARITVLRKFFEKEVKTMWPNAVINADEVERIAHISNITFPGIDAEMLLLRLDAQGIAVSTKSACLVDEDESYVLRAIGADSKSSLRFSFGKWTKKGELKKTLRALQKYFHII
jgi:cysteine desulfurase